MRVQGVKKRFSISESVRADVVRKCTRTSLLAGGGLDTAKTWAVWAGALQRSGADGCPVRTRRWRGSGIEGMQLA